MSRRLHSRTLFVMMIAGLSLLAVTANAQQLTYSPPSVDVGEVTLEKIETELAEVQANDRLDEDQKSLSIEILQGAKKSLLSAKAERQQIIAYKKAIDSVAEQTQQLNKLIEEQAEATPTIDKDASLESLSQQLASVKAELQSASAEAAKLNDEPTRRRDRLTEIPALIANANRSLEDVQKQLDQPPAANASPLESSARRLSHRAKTKEFEAIADRLVQEQAESLATSDLVPLRQKFIEQKVQRLSQEKKLLQDALVAMESEKARATTKALEKTTNEVPKSLHELAERNLELSKTQTKLIFEETQSEQARDNVTAALEKVTTELTTSQARVDAVGLTDALGLMFRERRQDFDQLRFKLRPSDEWKLKLQQYQIDSFRLEDELDSIKRKLADTDSPSVDWESEEIAWNRISESDAEWVLLKKRQNLIEETIEKQNDVLQNMLNNDTQQRLLMQQIGRFSGFVDRHLFWTRSAPGPSFSELQVAPQTLTWIMQRENWGLVGKQMLHTASSRPLSSLALLVFLVAIWFTRPRFRRTVIREGKEAHRFNSTFRSTLHSLSATVGASTAWPALFSFFGFLCLASSTGHSFVKGLGYAFAVVALFIVSRTFLKEICRPDGLGDAHFGWRSEIRLHLRRQLRWNMLFGGIAIFFLVLYHEHPDTMVRTFATRIASTSLFVITALFHHCILGRRSPLFPELVRSNPDSFFYRWRKLVWLVAVGMPVIFGFMSMAGYLETAFRLGRSLQSTFFLLVFVVVLLGILSRWLTLYRRDVTRRNATELRQRRLASSPESEAATIASEAGIVLEDEALMDLPTLDYQTRLTAFFFASIIAFFGLAYIWSDLVPALSYLDEITAWTVDMGEEAEVVTLKDLICALLMTAAVFFSVRNLPSMLELLVLSRTKLDGGARYAISTLLRYVLFIVGGLIVLNLLSLPYHQLGWLVAAASVGLGFGLQEIVANFVSGIILLLERPVRVGDVVTIDGTTGIVSRIQMRATTVTNWDRKELVIPNKDLITQKLLNWSLSNVVNRLTIEIGVAYGTDPDRVRNILRDVLLAHPEVLQDPPPLINFDTFGDNSLNFVVRFFLPKLDNRIGVTHQINTAIAKAFAKADISVPFPQRDVHFFQQPEQK